MDRIALDLGFIQIYWYSIFILVGVLFASTIIFRECKRQKINEDFVTNLIFYGMIFGLIGARLYYCLFNLDYYSKYPLEILEVWNGGLAIHGGIIAGLIFVFFYTKKYKAKFLKITDIIAPGLILGQAVGRWGNFFNMEAYGRETTRVALEKLGIPNFVIDGMNINGTYYQPMFLYESIWNVFGFIALLMLRKFKYLKTGQLTGFYLMWYSFGRFFVEIFRSDSLMLGNLKMAQLMSVGLFVIGLFMFIFCKRGSRFEGLYKEVDTNQIKF